MFNEQIDGTGSKYDLEERTAVFGENIILYTRSAFVKKNPESVSIFLECA